MEKHCTTVYFTLKKTRKDKNGDSPIVAWIAVNSDRTSYYTGKKIKVSEWDEKKQLVKGTSDKAKREKFCKIAKNNYFYIYNTLIINNIHFRLLFFCVFAFVINSVISH